MLLATKNRFLSLFSGYPWLPDDPLRIQLDYDDHYSRTRPADEAARAQPAPLGPAEPDELASGRSRAPAEPLPDNWDLADPLPFRLRLPPAVTPKLGAVPPAPLDIDLTGARGGGSAGAGRGQARKILVTHEKDGDQADLRADQVNVLHDNDVFGEPFETAASGSGATLHDLVGTAAAHQLEAYAGATASPEAVAAALELAAVSDANGTEPRLVPGVTIDGAAIAAGVAADAMPPDPTESLPPVPTESDANMSVVVAGDNLAVNSARLIDKQGGVGTLVVLGDSYTSDAIVQTNVLVDESTVAGSAQIASLQTMGSSANNMAEFIQALDHNPYAMGAFAGLRWNVDRIDGNFYDVKLVSQFNYLRDNDVVQQTASDHYKFVETGSNALANELSLLHTGKQYDLVIVGGDYFGVNWIFQTNVLLNSDYVLVNAGEGAAGEVTVTTGGNWLVNSATLADYAAGGVQALTPQMKAIADALMGGATSLDLAAGFAFPGDGSSTLNVLFITGDYYNMNVLSQTNVIGDSDQVAQTLGNGEAGYVSTGGNVAANEALLVSIGPLGGQYVGGAQYSEAVLVQTNIITQSADIPANAGGVVFNDPGTLAPEAAAIIQHSPLPAPAPQEAAISSPPPDTAVHANPDPLSGVMT